MSIKHTTHPDLPPTPAKAGLETGFAHFAAIYWWINPATLRRIIERAREDDGCVTCKIAEARESGEIKPPPRCATHYDRSLLTELAVAGYRCKVCDQYVWPREMQPPTE